MNSRHLRFTFVGCVILVAGCTMQPAAVPAAGQSANPPSATITSSNLFFDGEPPKVAKPLVISPALIRGVWQADNPARAKLVFGDSNAPAWTMNAAGQTINNPDGSAQLDVVFIKTPGIGIWNDFELHRLTELTANELADVAEADREIFSRHAANPLTIAFVTTIRVVTGLVGFLQFESALSSVRYAPSPTFFHSCCPDFLRAAGRRGGAAPSLPGERLR